MGNEYNSPPLQPSGFSTLSVMSLIKWGYNNANAKWKSLAVQGIGGWDYRIGTT